VEQLTSVEKSGHRELVVACFEQLGLQMSWFGRALFIGTQLHLDTKSSLCMHRHRDWSFYGCAKSMTSQNMMSKHA